MTWHHYRGTADATGEPQVIDKDHEPQAAGQQSPVRGGEDRVRSE
jgi:hypothetical protein